MLSHKGRGEVTNAPTRLRGNHLHARRLFSLNWENSHGTEVFEDGIRQGRSRNEEAQGWYLEERAIGQEGQEPQAGDRDRSFRGEGRGSEGAEEGFEEKGQEAQSEALGLIVIASEAKQSMGRVPLLGLLRFARNHGREGEPSGRLARPSDAPSWRDDARRLVEAG